MPDVPPPNPSPKPPRDDAPLSLEKTPSHFPVTAEYVKRKMAAESNGKPILSSKVVKFLLPIIAISGAIALAPTMGVDVSFLPPLVPKYAALISFIGMTLGLAGPGIRK
jgi:hypothetical protein